MVVRSRASPCILLVVLALVPACKATVGDPSSAGAPSSAPVSGARRLTANEYDNTLRDLLQDTSRPGQAALPQDPTDPFDNNYQLQLASGALVGAAENLAQSVAERAMANAAVRASLIPCTPKGPDDAACFRQVIRSMGRRFLRRPLTDDDVSDFAGLQALAVESHDFNVGVKLVLQAMLQDPEFLYRVEVGTSVPGKSGVAKLNDWEMATRLSYFLWGTTPPDWLLDQAAAGKLQTPEGIQAAAQKLLADPHARSRVERYHALWLSYFQLPHAAEVDEAMTRESAALVDRVVFEKNGDYFDLFRSTDTFVNDLLAQQYGLPRSGDADFHWVSYGASGRQGILSHGAVLAAGAKFADTSPTQRGKWVRNRLLCQEIPPPPPTTNVDQPPAGGAGTCKKDRYLAHANVGSCVSCHQQMDPIGFGLENYDQNGVFRTTDVGQPACVISGNGEVAGMGTFQGPKGLEDLLVNSGQLEGCVVRQVYRFAEGRRETDADAAFIAALTQDFKSHNRNFQGLLLRLVSDPSFAYRSDE